MAPGWPLLLVALVSVPSAAEACATCGVGDPTLTVMGAEQPRSGRLRLSLELQGRWDGLVEEVVQNVLLVESSAALSVSYAPTDRISLSATMPIVLRDVRYGNLAHDTTLGPGDAELRARFVLLRDRAFAPENLLGSMVGVRSPTSVDMVGSDGRLLSDDAQSGSGTLDPLLGLFFGHFEAPWSFFGSAVVSVPVCARFDDAPGPSLRATAALQYRVDRWITLRGAVDARLDAPATIGGQTAPDSDHFGLFVSPDLLWSPVSDWIFQVGVRAPVLQISEQGRQEGWYFRLAVTVDVS